MRFFAGKLLVACLGFMVVCQGAFGASSWAVLLDGPRLGVRGALFELSEMVPGISYLESAGGRQINWQPEQGPERVQPVACETPLGPGIRHVWGWPLKDGARFEWIITELNKHDAVTLQCRFVNSSSKAVQIRNFNVLSQPVGGLKIDGSPKEWLASSRHLKYGRYYDRVSDLIRRGRSHEDRSRNVFFEEDFCLYRRAGEPGLSIQPVAGVSFVSLYFKVPENGALSLQVVSDMCGVEVPVGASRDSETLLLSGCGWRTAGQNAVQWLRSAFQFRKPRPACGWGALVSEGERFNAEKCGNLATFIKENRDRYPLDFIDIDDGWAIGPHLLYASKNYPDGLGSVTKMITDAGALPGVALNPLMITKLHVKNGKAFHRGEDGTFVRLFDPSWYIGFRTGAPMHVLDPSHPVVQEYVRGQFRQLYGLGVRCFRLTHCHMPGIISGYYDKQKTNFEVQRLFYELIRSQIGEDAYLLCSGGGPRRVKLGLVDFTGITTSTSTKWGFCHSGPGGLRDGRPKNVHGGWFPILQIAAASAAPDDIMYGTGYTRLDDSGLAVLDSRFNGRDPGDANKPMKKQISLAEVQTYHGFVGLAGGTVQYSDLIDAPHYDNNRRLAEIAHPTSPDRAWNFSGGSDIYAQQFGFVADRPWGHWISMVVWNPDHRKGPRPLAIDMIPPFSKRFHVWSFWNEQYLGIQEKSFVLPAVSRYESRLLRLTPVADGPQLIGSSLHLTMGGAEIKGMKTSASTCELELDSAAGALDGILVFYSEKPLKLSSSSGCEAELESVGEKLYSLQISARRRSEKQAFVLNIL